MAFWGRRNPQSKYKNVPVKVGDRTFLSKAEAHWYQELLKRYDLGHIRNLVLQPSFKMEANGVKICHYLADFLYDELQLDGTWVTRIDDVKGGQLSDVFKLKLKMLKAFHYEQWQKFRIIWVKSRKRAGELYFSSTIESVSE